MQLAFHQSILSVCECLHVGYEELYINGCIKVQLSSLFGQLADLEIGAEQVEDKDYCRAGTNTLVAYFTLKRGLRCG